MIASVDAELGGLDVLVNNAGTTRYAALADLDALDDAIWDHVFAVNLRGPFDRARAAAPLLRRGGRGKIVNTASNSAFRPTGTSIPYMTSKAALVMLTRESGARIGARYPGERRGAWRPGDALERAAPATRRRGAHGCRPEPAGPLDPRCCPSRVFLAATDSVTGKHSSSIAVRTSRHVYIAIRALACWRARNIPFGRRTPATSSLVWRQRGLLTGDV